MHEDLYPNIWPTYMSDVIVKWMWVFYRITGSFFWKTVFELWWILTFNFLILLSKQFYWLFDFLTAKWTARVSRNTYKLQTDLNFLEPLNVRCTHKSGRQTSGLMHRKEKTKSVMVAANRHDDNMLSPVQGWIQALGGMDDVPMTTAEDRVMSLSLRLQSQLERLLWVTGRCTSRPLEAVLVDKVLADRARRMKWTWERRRQRRQLLLRQRQLTATPLETRHATICRRRGFVAASEHPDLLC